MLLKTIRSFASWWLTVILFLFLCASYIFFTFGEDPYGKWINFVFHTLVGLITYGALIVNFLFASIVIVYERLELRKVTPEEIRKMDTHVSIPAPDNNSLHWIAEWMKKKGFPGDIRGNGVCSVNGRFSFLPGTMMRMGLIVLMASLLFSAYIRKTEETVLHEGEERVFFGKKVSLSAIKHNLPEEFLQVGEESTFRLDGVSAMLLSSDKKYTVTPGFPTRIEGLYYRITHLGFSHPLSVRASLGDLNKTIDLDVLPPGKTDIVALPSGVLFLTFGLQPEKTISKGLLKGKQFNLGAPLYHVVIQKGKEKGKPEGITVRPGEQVTSEGMSITLGENSPYIKIQSVYDPALIWIYIGILLTLIGITFMSSRFFWYEKRISAVLTDSVIFIGYSEEFYKKWGIHKFYRWREELRSH